MDIEFILIALHRSLLFVENNDQPKTVFPAEDIYQVTVSINRYITPTR